ncbi:MAG TPA: DUF5719 family protein [Mycobacteriales bacterium]|jgi:hypothetical protein|nr:DUF5719 family protein [Mycobacteriales bacterium]
MSRFQVPLAVVVALVAIVVLAIVGSVVGSAAQPLTLPPVATAPVTSSTLVCPSVTGQPAGTVSHADVADVASALSPPSRSTGSVTATVLAAANTKTTSMKVAPTSVVTSVAKKRQTIAIATAGSIAATTVADEVTATPAGAARALSGVRCEAPETDWWFAGADGRVGFSDTLVLANPAPTQAVVSVSIWGPGGPRLNSRLGVLRLAAQSHLVIPIAAHAPDIARLAVHVHAESGAVSAAMFDERTSALASDGSDYLPPTAAPSRSLVIAGFLAGKGSRQVIIANPGGVDATVGLRLVTASGSFVPSGASQVVVRAGRTSRVDLDRAFAGTTGAVQLSSDQPIVAQGLAVRVATPQRPDLMWLAATPPLAGPAAVATGRVPTGGHAALLLTAPQGAAQVRVTAIGGKTRTISIAAGRSSEVDITSTVTAATGPCPFVVTPIGSEPVYGVRVLSYGAGLITAEPLVELPRPIPLPPVQQDQGIATR